MKNTTRHAATLAFAFSLTTAIMPASTARAEDFYAGKTLHMVVGFGAGTGNDLYMRLLARHMGNHIPGKPTIVPENKPGAASLVMMNYLYNVAPRDGTVIGMPARNLFIEPLIGNAQAKYDARKFTWIGSMSRDTALCFTWHSTGIKTLDDAKAKEVLVGSTGAASNSSLFPLVLNDLFGTKFKPVVGYVDSAAIGIAMERGEVAGYCSFPLGGIRSARPQWIDNHLINILVQLTTRKHPDLPDVPLIMDIAPDDSVRQTLRLILGDQEAGRPLAGPPGMPQDRLAILRKAFDETTKDPAYIAEAKATGVDIDGPIDGAAVEKVVDGLYATPAAIVARVKAYKENVAK